MRSGKVHFNIYGEDLTRIARDIVLDEEWEKSVSLLTEGLIGITLDIVFEILMGNKRLDGDAHKMTVIEDDDNNPETKKYKQNVDFIYGNLYYKSGKWY